MIILFLLLVEFLDPVNSDVQITSKIVGGVNAEITEFPSFASLVFVQPRGMKLICGGTYIRKFWILTAAHCVIQRGMKIKLLKTSELLVRMGMTNLNDTYQERQPIKFYKHKDYPSRANPSSDVGLIRIEKEFEINDKVGLATIVDLFNFSTKVVVVGFGMTVARDRPGLPPPFHLQKVELVAAEVYECSIVCEDPTPRGACFGDSGGPLYVRESKMLAGVVSKGVCSQGLGIFVNVFGYRMWIWNTINEAVKIYDRTWNCVNYILLLNLILYLAVV